MRGIKLFLLPLAVAVMTVFGSSEASAIPITYSEEAVISGTLDGVPFTGEEITIWWTGDTDDVAGGAGFFTNTAGANAVSFSITNVGSGLFTDSIYVYDNQTFAPPTAGFFSTTEGGTILGTQDNAFAAYDLTSAFGPLTAGVFFRPDLSFGTNAGALNIAAVRQVSTFTAVTDVPEPATLALFGLGLAGALRARKRAR